MKILVRDKKENNWKKVTSTVFTNALELRELLYGSPDLIPFNEVNGDGQEIRVCLKDLDFPGTGGTELLVLDEHGNITLAECVLSADPIKKRVIGQLMGYAAHLWQKSYLEFDLMFFELTGKGIVELFSENISKGRLDEESLKFRISSNLSLGSFRMLIASDMIDEELKRTINFLRMGSASFSCDIYGLQMGYFSGDTFEIVVPKIFGDIKQVQDFDTGESASFNPKNLYDNLNDFSSKYFQRHYADRGKSGAYAFWMNKGEVSIPIYTIFDKGVIQLNINSVEGLDKNVAEKFLKKLQAIPFLANLTFASTYPVFKFEEVFSCREDFEKFKAAILFLKNEIEEKN